MNKLIITAAVTGGEPVTKEMTPHVPSSPKEIVEETVKCWKAGASIVHLHAKDPETGKPVKIAKLPDGTILKFWTEEELTEI